MPAPFATAAAAAPSVEPGPTYPQEQYLRSLLAQRDLRDVTGGCARRSAEIGAALDQARVNVSTVNNELADAGLRLLTRSGASRMIDWLKTLPLASLPPVEDDEVEVPEVPAGRYAVSTEIDAVNRVAFYKVDRPTEGKWAGRVFVKLMVSDEEVRLSRAGQALALSKIAAVGAEAASKAYGREIGKCGVCGRTLTNDDSRALGIGPKCAEMF